MTSHPTHSLTPPPTSDQPTDRPPDSNQQLNQPNVPTTSHNVPPPQSRLPTPPAIPTVPSEIAALLGPEISAWPLSEQSFRDALLLRTEQERTKQEQYRLELRNRSVELLKLAVSYNIPHSLLPVLYGDPVAQSDRSALEDILRNQPLPRAAEKAAEVLKPPASEPGSPERTTQTAPPAASSVSSASSAPSAPPILPSLYAPQIPQQAPRSFVYPPPSAASPLQPPRLVSPHLSPARMPSPPRRLSQPIDSRQLPLPRVPETLTSPSGPQILNPTTPNNSTAASSHATPSHSRKRSLDQHTETRGKLSPKPAQPPPPPSAMTNLPNSLQHIIQFHHWQPEDGTEGPQEPEPTAYGHKRRRSLMLTPSTEPRRGHARHYSEINVRSAERPERPTGIPGRAAGPSTAAPPQSQPNQSNQPKEHKERNRSAFHVLADAAAQAFSRKEKDKRKRGED